MEQLPVKSDPINIDNAIVELAWEIEPAILQFCSDIEIGLSELRDCLDHIMKSLKS